VPPKIAGTHRAWLVARTAAAFTLRGLVAELAGRGLPVDYRTVWTFIRREGLSFKKNRAGERAKRSRRRPLKVSQLPKAGALTILPTNLICPWAGCTRRNQFNPDGINSPLAGSRSSANVEITFNWRAISAIKLTNSASRCTAATSSLPRHPLEAIAMNELVVFTDRGCLRTPT
jgi:hypothetical protein